MITELGLPGLSRGGVCVCVWVGGGDPRGARWGDFTSLLRTCVLFLSTLGLLSQGVGGDQTVCPAASITGCREEGSPACVWAPGTSRAASAPQTMSAPGP